MYVIVGFYLQIIKLQKVIIYIYMDIKGSLIFLKKIFQNVEYSFMHPFIDF